jgi:hypothetical protein
MEVIFLTFLIKITQNINSHNINPHILKGLYDHTDIYGTSSLKHFSNIYFSATYTRATYINLVKSLK